MRERQEGPRFSPTLSFFGPAFPSLPSVAIQSAHVTHVTHKVRVRGMLGVRLRVGAQAVLGLPRLCLLRRQVPTEALVAVSQGRVHARVRFPAKTLTLDK